VVWVRDDCGLDTRVTVEMERKGMTGDKFQDAVEESDL
jgi:hypothetical protein